MSVIGLSDRTITQVCIMAEDVERVAQNYADILGFILPDVQTTLRHDETEATYYGAPTDARAKMAIFDVGRIQFEIMQPLEPPSAWNDYLEQHGDGIHHIAFFVQDAEVITQSFIDEGYKVTQYGLFTGKSGSYTYLNTDRDLGIVIELLQHFGGSPVLQGPPFSPDRGLGSDVVRQVGIIVHDIEATSRRYAEVLGFPPPMIFQTPGYEQSKTVFRGEHSEATAKLAFFSAGQLQIELIQPDEKPSVWREFLEMHGEGAHHIAFQVQDTKKATDYLERFDIHVVQQGLYADASGMYTYMSSEKALGVMIKLLENFPR